MAEDDRSTDNVSQDRACPSCHQLLWQGEGQPAPFAFCPHCRFPLRLIAGKYRLQQVLQEGGFGTLYLAKHTGLHRNPERVIKFIKPEHLASPSLRKRFQREVQLTAELSQRNLHIVRVYDDFGEVDHLGHYYVMEYLKGNNLRTWLADHQPLPMGLARQLFLQLCSAMSTAHAAQVIHRDLKPANLMLVSMDNAPHFLKVLDFGIARPTDDDTSGALTQGLVGTPAYMSPEQCKGEPIDTRSDIYAMGLILFEWLTGHHPLGAMISAAPHTPQEWISRHLLKQPAALAAVGPRHRTYPPGLEQVITKALAKQPHHRYPSVEHLEQAIRAAWPEETAEPPSLVPPTSESTPIAWQDHTSMLITMEGDDAPPPEKPPASTEDFTHPEPHVHSDRNEKPTEPTPTPIPAPKAPMTGAMGSVDLDAPGSASWSTWLAVLGLLVLISTGFLWLQRNPEEPDAAATQHHAETSKTRRVGDPPAIKRAKPPALRRSRQGTRQAKQIISPKHQPTKRRRSASRTQPLPRVRASKGPKRTKRPVGGSRPKRTKGNHTTRRPQRRPRSRVKRWQRHVPGCPKAPLYWVHMSLPKKQLDAISPHVLKGRWLKQRGGLCVGVSEPSGKIVFGKQRKGFVPCTLYPARLSPQVRVVLQSEGLIEPTSAQYCLSPRKQ